MRRLITDVWVDAASWPSALNRGVIRRFASRFHQDIPQTSVRHFTTRFAIVDSCQRVLRQNDADYHAGRNATFDRLAARELSQITRSADRPPAVFSYAHSCRDLFRLARAAGCPTVLGQFDPGPREADIVDAETLAEPEFATRWKRYPASYVDRWWEEVANTNDVLANSEWSAECLVAAGVPVDRIRVIPLVYVPKRTIAPRRYPAAFTRTRPLIVLFLGQVILRKGVARLIRAARELRSEPVEIRLVGPTDITNLSELIRGLPVRWYGSVPRDQVDTHYADADVFILPTLSDGYALTQLEARSWRLPVIASRRCGEVVRPGIDGFLLSEPTSDEIVRVLRECLAAPAVLEEMSGKTAVNEFGLDRLADEILRLLPGES